MSYNYFDIIIEAWYSFHFSLRLLIILKQQTLNSVPLVKSHTAIHVSGKGLISDVAKLSDEFANLKNHVSEHL
jgi:hypothetical protein